VRGIDGALIGGILRIDLRFLVEQPPVARPLRLPDLPLMRRHIADERIELRLMVNDRDYLARIVGRLLDLKAGDVRQVAPGVGPLCRGWERLTRTMDDERVRGVVLVVLLGGQQRLQRRLGTGLGTIVGRHGNFGNFRFGGIRSGLRGRTAGDTQDRDGEKRQKVKRAMRTRTRVAVLGLLVAGLLALFAGPAAAHPLGNFTVNRYARVELSTNVVRVYYVLDEAEIPTFQEGNVVHTDQARFVRERVETIRRHLSLNVGGKRVELHAADTLFSEPEGQGGLPTLRLAIRFEGTVHTHAGDSLPTTFADVNEPNRVGWREIVVTATGNAQLSSSSVPAADHSDELRHYPADLVQAPLDVRTATFAFTPGTEAVAPAPLTSAAAAPKRSGGAFTNLITKHLTPITLVGMVGLALLFGAGHALAPGHGKSVMAAYLVGTRGRPIDALLLGAVVSFMHTASVLVLAGVLYQVNRSTSVERLYPVLTLLSGAIVVVFGLAMARSRLRTMHRRTANAAHHHHDHDGDHDHEHHHQHTQHEHGAHTHTHELPDDVPPLSRRGLVLLATSGGLLPSPSAVLVLLAAFASGRAALGLGLVAAFSIGLAVTLTGIGLSLVFGGRVLERRGLARPGLMRVLPIASACAITVAGSVVMTQGITKLA
jgi:nickel/cobalt exporter